MGYAANAPLSQQNMQIGVYFNTHPRIRRRIHLLLPSQGLCLPVTQALGFGDLFTQDDARDFAQRFILNAVFFDNILKVDKTTRGKVAELGKADDIVLYGSTNLDNVGVMEDIGELF